MGKCELYSKELYHYGVKGMKWGVRRFQKEGKNLVLRKGTTVKRVSADKDDKTYDNKKYVSINQKDHSKWERYLGEGILKEYGKDTWNHTYRTTKDLRIMSIKQQGKLFTDMLMQDPEFAKRSYSDLIRANMFSNKPAQDAAELISRNIALQTETGKAFVQRVIKEGYDAVHDTHGTNLATYPLIVLNPDSNLERIGDPDYTSVTKKYRKQR